MHPVPLYGAVTRSQALNVPAVCAPEMVRKSGVPAVTFLGKVNVALDEPPTAMLPSPPLASAVAVPPSALTLTSVVLRTVPP